MTHERVSAIVLAGGRSSRFGRDKLLEVIDGRRLIDHAIAAVRPFASEVIVVTAPGSAMPLMPGVTVVGDDVAYGGPLIGLSGGLRAARQPTVLVIGGDMPTLTAEVAALLLGRLARDLLEAVVLEQDDRSRPLPVVLRREVAAVAAVRLVDVGERRLRALVEALDAGSIPESEWRAVDPEGRSVRDIDEQADLD
jgi:molybdenum cofactor guanylyltransferase